MKCHETERALLLDGSGELSAARKHALERHLATCAACQARQTDLARWSRFVRSADRNQTPLDALIARVMAVAANQRPTVPIIQYPAWRAALAAAASLVIMAGFVGLLALRPANTKQAHAGTARLFEVSSLLGMMMDHNQDAADAHTAMIEGDLQGFARQLLILEGLDASEVAETAEEPDEDVSRLEGQQPTTLQWRSMPELPSGIRV